MTAEFLYGEQTDQERNNMEEPVSLAGLRIAFAFTGSFCTLARYVEEMKIVRGLGASILPVLSFHARDLDSRFGTAAFWRQQMAEAAANEVIIDTIAQAEPLGPKNMADLMVIAPCSGNTAAKLAHGITDTPALMAAKSLLRGGKPVVLAIATNDGLAASGPNIAQLLTRKQIYFVPFGQDDPLHKPTSLMAVAHLLPQTIQLAAMGKQIQPILTNYT